MVANTSTYTATGTRIAAGKPLKNKTAYTASPASMQHSNGLNAGRTGASRVSNHP
jgi:hypothetical protein